MGIKERTMQFIDFKGLTKRQFCQKINVSHSYINDLKTMQSDKLEKISDVFPELNIIWLITGRGKMMKEGEAVTPSETTGLIDASTTSDVMDMPIAVEDKITILRNRVTLKDMEIMVLKRLLDDYVTQEKNEGAKSSSN